MHGIVVECSSKFSLHNNNIFTHVLTFMNEHVKRDYDFQVGKGKLNKFKFVHYCNS